MKKILAVVLTVLMLLPIVATIASAAIVVPEGTEVRNVAGEATVSVVDTNNLGISIGSDFVGTALNDGDRTTGTKSPKGLAYSYVLEYDQVYYFTEIVVACNGKGTLASGGAVSADTFNVKGLVIKVYDGSELVYESDKLDVSKLTEVSVAPEVKGDRVEVFKYNGNGARTEYMWEIETYAPNMTICSALEENVAAEATFSATGANANYWWAMDYKTWVDGDPTTGSHSPKGRNYSVWMHFKQEYLFSRIDLVCNTEGGATLASGATVDERTFGNAMMRVLVYNYNEDLVWDSDFVDTSTITTLSVAPYVEGAVIEIRFYNGNFGGGEYMYEVSAYSQSGDHVFSQTDEENPTCMLPGYRELTCHCGKVIKETLEATGFHKWGEGVVTKVPTETDNGVMTIPCTGCTSTKLRDIASLDHNWDDGRVVAPACDTEGYTLYTCKDSGCSNTYKADYTEALTHKWVQDSIVKSTVEEEGKIVYKCTACGEEKSTRLRKHKYTDNTAPFSKDDIVKYDTYINTSDAQYNGANYVGDVTNPENLFDDDIMSVWHGPAGSYVEVTLRKEFIFTSGYFYATSNWSSMTIEFYDAAGNLTCSYGTGNVNNGTDISNPDECDMLDALGGGTKALKIRIITNNPKWENGSACKLQELKLVAHKCNFTEEDYILSGSNYVAPTCDKNGKCDAICQVCLTKDTVVLETSANNGHTYSSDITVDVAPTCVATGVGHAKCTKCNETINGITIPATGAHEYTKEIVYVSAKCGFSGVKHKVCPGCNAVGEVLEIAPTGVHEYEWATKSLASYTAVGKTELCCIYCDVIDETTAENVIIDEKLEIPSNLVTYVSTTAGQKDGRNTLTFNFVINLEALPELELTCDVRVITTIRDAYGREASIESYGKYATNSYNAETGEFSITIYPANECDAFSVSTVARVMNFRGIVYKTYYEGSASCALAK